MSANKKSKTEKHSKKAEKELSKEEQNAVNAAQAADEKAVEAEVIEEKELSPEEQIAKLQTELNEAQDKILRNQAEFMNYRKRTAKEISNSRMFGLTDTVMPFLQVFDHFNMAVMAAENSDNMQAIRQGLEMILGEYKKALDELNVERIDANGQLFDPAMHDAVSQEASGEVPENHIIKQWSYGYKIGERLLRPARVIVSSGPEKAENNEQDEVENQEA